MRDSRRLVFQRFGRSYHLRIATADDLAGIVDLDEAFWVATGAPTRTMNCDRTFLDLVDTDRNGRIMCFELKDAIRWLLGNLRDTAGVDEGSTTLRLDAINTDHDEGNRIRLAATKVLDRLGLDDANEITLDQVRGIKSGIEAASVSEAGIVLPQAAADSEIRQFITDVIATVGGVPHPGGGQGVGQSQLDEFLKQASAYLDWQAHGRIGGDKTKSDLMPFGSETPRLFQLHAALRDKIDQYFAQCRAVAFDPRAAEQIGPRAEDIQALDLADPQAIDALMKDAPLAKADPDGVLTFDERINPHYASTLNQFREQVIGPTLGQTVSALAEPQWQRIKQCFAAYEAWINSKPGPAVEPLGSDTLTRYLDTRFAEAVKTIIAESNTTAIALDNIRLAEKLILYQAYMLPLANNFVSFPHLYDPHTRATFDLGALVMDGRRFNLSVKIDDRAKHSTVAKTSNIFLLYVRIIPPRGDKPYEIAVPVTSGGKGNLVVGKRGVFQDINGRESDAQVVQIIENPISVSEALVSPFKRIGKLLGGKIEALATAAEKKLDTAVTKVQAPTPPAQTGKPSAGLLAGGLLMGGGVAVAAVAAGVASVINALKGVAPLKLVIGIAAALFAVMLPMAIVAFLKLRKRDLSAILEGIGWAINARMRLTFRLGRFFTQSPGLPKRATSLHRRCVWTVIVGILIIAAVALACYLGLRGPNSQQSPTTRPASSPVSGS